MLGFTVFAAWAAAELMHAAAALFFLVTSRELFDDPRTVHGLASFLEVWAALVFCACFLMVGEQETALGVQLFLLSRLAWYQVAGAHLAWEAALRCHHQG